MSDKKIDAIKFDKRVTERLVNEGKVSREELKAYLDKLPDQTANCEDMPEEMLRGAKERISVNGTH